LQELGDANIFSSSTPLSLHQILSHPGCRLLVPVVIFGENNKGNVYNLISQIASNKFMMVGQGKNCKSMGYIGNIVEFLIRALDFGSGIHLFNYADKPDMTVKELVETVRSELGIADKPLMKLPYSIGMAGGRVRGLE